MPGRVPEDMPDRMPEGMSDRMSEDLPVPKRINVMVGIARSKVIIVIICCFAFVITALSRQSIACIKQCRGLRRYNHVQLTVHGARR